MSQLDAGYNPLAYHNGTIWPFDTAIAAEGLRRNGQDDAAATLAFALLDAAACFDHRLPELFAGFPTETHLKLPPPIHGQTPPKHSPQEHHCCSCAPCSASTSTMERSPVNRSTQAASATSACAASGQPVATKTCPNSRQTRANPTQSRTDPDVPPSPRASRAARTGRRRNQPRSPATSSCPNPANSRPATVARARGWRRAWLTRARVLRARFEGNS